MMETSSKVREEHEKIWNLHDEPEWIDLAEKNLEAGDSVQRSWPGYYEGDFGYIVLTKKRVLFVDEKGLVDRAAYLHFNIPYKNISKIEVKAKNNLIITESGSTRQPIKHIQTRWSSRVESSLKELMK